MNTLVNELNEGEASEKKLLAQIFAKIDEDGSGQVTFDELEEGAYQVREFKNWLRVMDIDWYDLRKLFDIIDEDGSGEIDPEEFIEFLYRMKNAESTTTTKFIKHMVEGLEKKSNDLMHKIAAIDELQYSVMRLKDEVKDASLRRQTLTSSLSLEEPQPSLVEVTSWSPQVSSSSDDALARKIEQPRESAGLQHIVRLFEDFVTARPAPVGDQKC